jgi:hypothetical protein
LLGAEVEVWAWACHELATNAVTASKQDRRAAMFANLGKLRSCILTPSGGLKLCVGLIPRKPEAVLRWTSVINTCRLSHGLAGKVLNCASIVLNFYQLQSTYLYSAT